MVRRVLVVLSLSFIVAFVYVVPVRITGGLLWPRWTQDGTGPWIAVSRVSLGCEQSGVKLYLAQRWLDQMAPVSEAFLMCADGRTAALDDMGQLRGRVRIESPEMALRYVRRRTSPPARNDLPSA